MAAQPVEENVTEWKTTIIVSNSLESLRASHQRPYVTCAIVPTLTLRSTGTSFLLVPRVRTHHGEAAFQILAVYAVFLKIHDSVKLLRAQQHRIRFSTGVDDGAFIFPLSGIAFLLVDLQEPLHQDAVLVEKLSKFVPVHRNCFVLLYNPVNEPREMQTISLLQNSFFGTKLRILSVRNNADIVKGMLTIAKATSKPHVDRIRGRMSLVRAHIIKKSPVWEMLRDML